MPIAAYSISEVRIGYNYFHLKECYFLRNSETYDQSFCTCPVSLWTDQVILETIIYNLVS